MLLSKRPFSTCMLLLVLLHLFHTADAQFANFDLDKWSKKLSSKSDVENVSFLQIYSLMIPEDPTIVLNILSQFESRISTENLYYKTRVHCLKAWIMYHFKKDNNISEISAYAELAVKEAYQTNDKQFAAFIVSSCARLMSGAQQLELAVIYRLSAEELSKQQGYRDYDYITNWGLLGEALFHSRDYEKSIFYTRMALENWKEKAKWTDYVRVRYYNTAGQAYEQLGKPDSALLYLDSSIATARKLKYDLWVAISSGFKGQVLFGMKRYAEAKPLLEYDYITNRNVNYAEDVAAKSLQWLARINIIEGKKDSALLKAKESLALLNTMSKGYYLQQSHFREMCYFTIAESYRALEKLDSFTYYNQMYNHLHDSIQQVAYASNSKLAQLKIDNENILRTLQLLQEEKSNEIIKRNLVMVAIGLIVIIVILYIGRLKLKQRHREELVMKEKNIAESELASAKEQMQLFTANIVEKSMLIEKLNEQISNKELNGHDLQILGELTNQTILTEADWDHFKRMFEKIYPHFFFSLKSKAVDITLAEQRMAALTRLNLTARQMASMLGISVDSVHKTKQRLRQRLHVASEKNLEEAVSEL